MSDAWLQEISKLYNVKLQGGRLSKEKVLRVKGREFRCDGYHSKSKTIFEFLGSRYHGAPRTSSWDSSTFGDTMKRLIYLNLAGYTVCYVWEKDYAEGRLFSGILHGTVQSIV